MANTIKIKQSSVASRVPQASDLEQGELAINTNDEKLYTKNSSGSVVELGRLPAINDVTDASVSSPVDGQLLQYNNSTGMWENVTINLPQFYEQTTEPTSPNNGDTWYDDSEGRVFIRVTGNWIVIADTNIVLGYDGGDSDNATYTETLDAGNASTSSYDEEITGGSA